MSAVSLTESRGAARAGGWSLIAAAIGFMTVFSYLAARFSYPDVLDGPAADVLPRLVALGSAGRAVWAIYALLPLLLIPAGIGSYAALREAAPNVMRAALVFSVVSAVSMLVGLARWPSVHWELARAYASASPETRAAIDAVFNGLNVYLGNYIGEFLGEFSLNAFFMLSAVALVKARQRVAGYVGLVVGVIGLVAAFRNATPTVGAIADVNNYVLPLWLIAFGVILLRAQWTRARVPAIA